MVVLQGDRYLSVQKNIKPDPFRARSTFAVGACILQPTRGARMA